MATLFKLKSEEDFIRINATMRGCVLKLIPIELEV